MAVVTTGELQDVQSFSQIVTTNKPTRNGSQAGCPSCRPNKKLTNNVLNLSPKHLHTFNRHKTVNRCRLSSETVNIVYIIQSQLHELQYNYI